MKRSDIIKKLIIEGFSEKTLVNFSDSQLKSLSDRILSENTPVLNIPKADTNAINDAKNQKQVFSTYESEIREEDDEKEKNNKNVTWEMIASALKKLLTKNEILSKGNYGFSLNESDDEKQSIMKRLLFKIDHSKDDSKLDDWIRIIKKINDGEIPEEVAGVLSSLDVDVVNEDVTKWVDGVVVEKYFSSKKEIMEVIDSKLKKEKKSINKSIPEFFTYDSIMNSTSSEPAIKPKTPTTKPTERPRPKHPLQPGKVPNPKPKAKVIPENKKK